MRNLRRQTSAKGIIINILLSAILAGLISGCAKTAAATMNAEEVLDKAQAVAANWCVYSKAEAKRLLDEYGHPDQIGPDRLVWFNRFPWNKIAVWNTENCRYSGTLRPDDMEQTVAYIVPVAKLRALAAFSRRLVVSQDRKQLTARGHSEALNFLALNLANEIVREDLSPGDARSLYARIYRLSKAGKSSHYMQGLLFVH
jgi:hypothetical protein